jgi:hypothetical protein
VTERCKAQFQKRIVSQKKEETMQQIKNLMTLMIEKLEVGLKDKLKTGFENLMSETL